MPRYFMHLSYRGAPFHGWQSQPNAISVQSTLEDALGKVLRCPTKIVGAGRTDTGVNARMMVAHFDSETAIADPEAVVRGLNSIVGRDIAVYSIRQVADDAHARFDATSRTYHYYASTEKTPFFHHLCWQAPKTLDFEAMNKAAEILLETEDFTSFAKLHTDNKTNNLPCDTRPMAQNRRGWRLCIRDHRRPLSAQYGTSRCRDACGCRTRETDN